MSLVEDIYEVMMREYMARQKMREEMLNKNKKVLTVTEIGFCEEKAILRLKGIKPKLEKEKIGARLHGTILHENFERLLKLYFKGKYNIENEVRIKMKDWIIAGHPDIMLVSKDGSSIYDFKFVNPVKFRKAVESDYAGLTHIWQLNLYMYMLQKNKINATDGNLVYVNKSAYTFRKNKQPMRLEEFNLKQINVPYNENVVKVLLKHALDIIEKFEKGEDGLGVDDTVEKLKEYYKIAGLNPSDIDAENFPKWGCEYCDYKDLCPIYQKKMEKEGEKGKEENVVKKSKGMER